jgi:hypothetical protein
MCQAPASNSIMAAGAQPETFTVAALADKRTAQLPLLDNASAELRHLALGAAVGQANAEHDLGTFFALGIEVPGISSAPSKGIVAPPIKA